MVHEESHMSPPWRDCVEVQVTCSLQEIMVHHDSVWSSSHAVGADAQ